MDESIWAELYEKAVTPFLHPVLVGFNVNLDRIIPVSHELLESEEFRRGELKELRSHLVHSMEHCTAEEWFVPDPGQYARYTGYFSKTGTLSMGGQAGIAALHLAELGNPNVICTAPVMGAKTREILINGGVQVMGNPSHEGGGPDTIHLVFEYKPGLVPVAEGVLARDNRFIASPRKTGENTILPEKSLSDTLSRISKCTRAFLSGYQYLQEEEDFIQAAHQIQALKEKNPDLRVHIECVSVTDERVIAGIMHYILPAADSAGMNESELSLMLEDTKEPHRIPKKQDLRTPAGLLRSMLKLAEQKGLVRIHLHTFGYYLLVIRKDCCVPADSRAALLYAAKVVAEAAGGTGTSISTTGLEAVKRIAEEFGPAQSPGIFREGNYYLVVVPTLIAKNISKTVGLGDILSSTALVADSF
jgi:ADP-dependent phosphofructokinase/glucokinase